LEFNLGGEATKSGWTAGDESVLGSLIPQFSSILDLPHLEVRGLMTMPPIGAGAEAVRPYFQTLRLLQGFLRERLPGSDWSELSMGTSLDFETAVQEGATLVRVGTAIVGPRPSA
jgi:uncharacterized pyridoxal phosphate-containing UPF0001 family protein